MSPVEDYCFEALRLFEGWQRSLSEETLQVWEQHLKNCALCQESTEIQAISEIWQELETLTVPEISSGFESDLLQQIQDLEQERLQRKNFWKHLDMWVDFLHVPAVAVVLTLLVWVGTSSSQRQAQLPEQQQEHLEMLQQKLQAVNEITVQESLEKIQNVYMQRSAG